MDRATRRAFLGAGGATVLAGAETPAAAAGAATLTVPLNGQWQFRTDPVAAWADVSVPHTWQASAGLADYTGVAWYRRDFEAPADWASSTVRVEFEAVYHSARVWVNGQAVGAHDGRGYTAFALDITAALRFGAVNTIQVRADNSFRDDMLPRNNSYDWAPDGGITRPVTLLVAPRVYIERVEVDAAPDRLDVRAVVRNASGAPARVPLSYTVAEEDTGRVVLRVAGKAAAVPPGATETLALPAAAIKEPRLWHFDHPHLYRLKLSIGGHELETTFGVRTIEVKDGGFYLNGERVWLMGVERMAGSHPDYGMAEPGQWIVHDHDDMKELNCVFTRVHWPQDQRVLDYCDRNGILIQVEVPTWGGATFQGMAAEPSAAIMQNGLEQLREMVARDRNHPSVFAWGLCNEVGGQNPAAKAFVRTMFREARRLDPHRLLSYASNSLKRSVEQDVAGEMDVIELNEYYETWYGKTVEAVRANLDEIRKAYPGKMVLISEYGMCECNPFHKGGDARRIDILRTHNEVYREFPNVGGAIFFCYNDYRTHMGDKGKGRLKQRVHGVVDLYGARKPSFEALRAESSPVERIDLKWDLARLTATVATRRKLPCYTLDGYKLRWIVYGFDDLPMEQYETPMPKLAPGGEFRMLLHWEEKDLRRIRVDVVRPTGFSALTAWA